MSKRFNLFNAGYTVYAPALYYLKLSLAESLSKDEDEEISNRFAALRAELEESSNESKEQIEAAIVLAEQFELLTLPSPSSSNDYFDWVKHYIDAFENRFPMSRIDHYYFLYSRKLSEIAANMAFLKWCVGQCSDIHPKAEVCSKMDKALKDTEYIIFKLIASAALLSSEPRHSFFNANYKTISAGYEPLRNLSVSSLGKEQLQDLAVNAEKFETSVREGFTKCVSLLEELQV
jgi:hypothetical protein